MKGVIVFFLLSIVSSWAQKPLQTYSDCTFQKTPWGDGDSFLVKAPGQVAFSVRLYGVDCVEWHVTDATDSSRLNKQRSYFGISKVDSDPKKAAEIAKGYGEQAHQFVEKAMKKPFTVYTAHANARGDARFTRVYAFIVTSDGKDLAEELVKNGLARAFGVVRQTYHTPAVSAEAYAANVKDLEFQAGTAKTGIWKITNWDQLPKERKAQREDDAKHLVGIDTIKDLKGKKISLNSCSRAELLQLPGVGEITAERIISHRPFRRAEDLLKVPGIGFATLAKLKPHLAW